VMERRIIENGRCYRRGRGFWQRKPVANPGSAERWPIQREANAGNETGNVIHRTAQRASERGYSLIAHAR